MPPKPAPMTPLNKTTAAEWARRWRRLRKFTLIEWRAFAKLAAHPGYHPDTRRGYEQSALAYETVRDEMSRLARSTPRKGRKR